MLCNFIFYSVLPQEHFCALINIEQANTFFGMHDRFLTQGESVLNVERFQLWPSNFLTMRDCSVIMTLRVP